MKVILTVLFCLSIIPIYSQMINVSNETYTIELTKTFGLGPSGNVSYAITDVDNMKYLNKFEKPTNSPKDWLGLKHYFFILNKAQYFYQEYSKKNISLNDLKNIYKNEGIDLQDTTFLSKSTIITGFKFSIGRSAKSGKQEYVIDKNNNNNYNDDLVKQLNNRVWSFEGNINCDTILSEYYFNGKVLKDTSMVVFQKDENDSTFFLTFAQRYEKKIFFEDNPFYLTKNLTTKGIFVLPDKLYFESPNKKYNILPGQFFDIYNESFLIEKIIYDGRYVVLKKDKKKNIALPNMAINKNYDERISSQVNFIAPNITGDNIIDSEEFDLNKITDKYIFAYFWSTSCIPCLEDLPNLNRISEQHKENLIILGVCDARSEFRYFQGKYGINWPNLILGDSNTKIDGYSIYKYPTSYLIGPNKKILHIDLNSTELEEYLNNFLK